MMFVLFFYIFVLLINKTPFILLIDIQYDKAPCTIRGSLERASSHRVSVRSRSRRRVAVSSLHSRAVTGVRSLARSRVARVHVCIM